MQWEPACKTAAGGGCECRPQAHGWHGMLQRLWVRPGLADHLSAPAKTVEADLSA